MQQYYTITSIFWQATIVFCALTYYQVARSYRDLPIQYTTCFDFDDVRKIRIDIFKKTL